ncbi:hypothetical protein CDEF62S_01696 [Castellaniella defragrans]
MNNMYPSDIMSNEPIVALAHFAVLVEYQRQVGVKLYFTTCS